METNHHFLEGLRVDDSATEEILDLCKWARFLGIVSFIMCALIELGGVYLVYTVYEITSKYSSLYSGNYPSGLSYGVALFYCATGLVWFFPSLFLFQAGSRLKQAVDSLSQEFFVAGLAKLKACFRFWAFTLLLLVLVTIFLAIFNAMK